MKAKLLIGLLAAPLIFGFAMPSYAKQKAEPVTCEDGSTSSAKGRGACSGHGGVKKAEAATATQASASTPAPEPKAKRSRKVKDAAAEAAPAAPAAPEAAAKVVPAASKPAAAGGPEGATAKCKDGSYSHSTGHKGACSRHGGVSEWLSK